MRDRIVFKPWRKRTGLRNTAGRRYEVDNAGCMVDESCWKRSWLASAM